MLCLTRKGLKAMVYFIKAEKTELIKIGRTKDKRSLQKRLKQLATENADKLVLLFASDSGTVREIDLHTKFRIYHHHGEWFCPNEELVTFIELLCKNIIIPIPISVERKLKQRTEKRIKLSTEDELLLTTMEKLGC